MRILMNCGRPRSPLWGASHRKHATVSHGRCEMRHRILELIGVVAVIMVASLVSVAGQAPTTGVQTGPALKTSWGDPDLQGLWSIDFQIPLQRPAKYAGKEFFT